MDIENRWRSFNLDLSVLRLLHVVFFAGFGDDLKTCSSSRGTSLKNLKSVPSLFFEKQSVSTIGRLFFLKTWPFNDESLSFSSGASCRSILLRSDTHEIIDVLSARTFY